ncbi:amidohydrolase family protein [Lewinella sp. JB7]|uniref:metal-dependent hydrolase family protein n=1 Tax=Lewinella sp. JB7 TaxID=2962887 RepID=UPI0020C9715A|nr:amidohydrolase family protein [Lewinella sp. JB7]MCP9234786.1 amidohydrolase family protein [Lewinella sp. JB7]
MSTSAFRTLFLVVLACSATVARTQENSCSLLVPRYVFDGTDLLSDRVVLIVNDTIAAVGPVAEVSVPGGCAVQAFPEGTLLPGMIEGHAHLLLHPYNETSWNDQVLRESHAERAIRGGVHARESLRAGFTTVRDLGSEGAGYTDVGLKQAIEKGVIPGPRMIVAGRAIVATGSYGPAGFADHVAVPLGAEPADGNEGLTRVVRDQIGHGADVIKVYADYRWGPERTARPTFTQEELETIVRVAESSGRRVVAHAATAEGMRRATLAGVSTIEHGDGGTPEVFALMAERGVALCPTLAAGDAILQYGGWRKGVDPEPDRIVGKRRSFADALAAGVTIVAGGDVGVFPHGDNVRELELMVDYGMEPVEVLRSVTSGNAEVFGIRDRVGRVQAGLLADLVLVNGNPTENISVLREVLLVWKGGRIVK